MWSFPRPDELTLATTRVPVEGVCANCGSRSLASYPVISDGGWWNVVKCTECLESVSRDRGPRLGVYTPQGADIEAEFLASGSSGS
jgi:hypothetical protein